LVTVAAKSLSSPIALAAAALLPVVSLIGCSDQGPALTAYATELGKITQEIARLEGEEEGLQLVRQRYLEAGLTADFSDLADAEREVQRAISEMGPLQDLLLAKANLEMKLHRLEVARETLASAPHLEETPAGQSLLADIALQQGRYDEALAGFSADVAQRPGWENLARLAYYRSMTGEPDLADRLYARAQDLLTAKEMRHYAWLELQRGIIDLNAGRYADALAHYRHADRAYSGYWLIEEHIGEVLALLGRTEESEEIYERVVRSTGKPDLMTAYARLIAERDPQRSAELAQVAGETFERQMALYPEAAVGHYLSFLIDAEPDADRLIDLARMNLAARPNTDAKLLLARAYAKAGRFEEARSLVAEVAASPWRPRGLEVLQNELKERT
jgi:tetratricopeptide (TPR) repeat protein